MVDFQYKDSYGVKDLEEIVRILRAPGGCPWDAEQTHQSIRRNFLEEAYEAVEAIDEGSPEHLEEELGDVLGRYDGEEQRAALARTRAELGRALEQAREESEKQGRMYRALGLTVGAMLAILLL